VGGQDHTVRISDRSLRANRSGERRPFPVGRALRDHQGHSGFGRFHARKARAGHPRIRHSGINRPSTQLINGKHGNREKAREGVSVRAQAFGAVFPPAFVGPFVGRFVVPFVGRFVGALRCGSREGCAMSRTNLSPFLHDSGLIMLSRTALLSLAGGLVVLTGLLMMLFSQIDLETWIAGQELGVKVGGTSISLAEFRELKAMVPASARALSNGQFAAELVETLLLAEAGRQLGLDKQDGFRQEILTFDQAVSDATSNTAQGVSPATELTRAFFLIEELARRTREKVADSVPDLRAVPPQEPADAASGSTIPDRLHIQTILVSDQTSAERVIALAASGEAFTTLNSSFSKSLYAPVGGDLGWKTQLDLPPGIFSALASAPVGSLTVGFTDAEGVHLFLVKGRRQISPQLFGRQAAERTMQENRRRAEQSFIQTMRATIPCFVNPSLQNTVNP